MPNMVPHDSSQGSDVIRWNKYIIRMNLPAPVVRLLNCLNFMHFSDLPAFEILRIGPKYSVVTKESRERHANNTSV